MNPEIRVNLGNLVLSISDALDLATPSLALHQQRTAFAAWELCKQAQTPEEVTRRVFIAGLLHDIGALSLEEKILLRLGETSDTEPHCILGAALFKDLEWLEPAASAVRYHHRRWDEWDEAIDNQHVFESQVIFLADFVDRQIDRDKYILHQDQEITEKVKSLAGQNFHPRIVDLFLQNSSREEFWLDLVSPRLYSLLLHNGPFRTMDIDLSDLSSIGKFFRLIIDYKSAFTATHSSGVAECAVQLSILFGLTEVETKLMEVAGHLHDLGKLVIPTSILNKPGKLTSEEFKVIKQHTYYTFSILNSIGGLQQISEWAAFHHEKLDGSGYPFQRTSKELSIGSRIMAVADIFTALSEDRPYRERMDNLSIMRVLVDLSDREFLDGKMVTLALENMDLIKEAVGEKQTAARVLYEERFARLVPS